MLLALVVVEIVAHQTCSLRLNLAAPHGFARQRFNRRREIDVVEPHHKTDNIALDRLAFAPAAIPFLRARIDCKPVVAAAARTRASPLDFAAQRDPAALDHALDRHGAGARDQFGVDHAASSSLLLRIAAPQRASAQSRRSDQR